MSMLEGTFSARRFAVLGEVQPGFRPLFQDLLEANRFRRPDSAAEWGPVAGWTSALNMLDTDFTDINAWSFGEWVILGLRIDTKKVPRKLVKAHLDKKMRAWCREHNRPRCPNPIKAELKEAVVGMLASKQQPTSRMVEVVWNIDGGYLLLGSTSDGVGRALDKLFQRTFGEVGLSIEWDNPWSWLPEPLRVRTLEALGGEGGEEEGKPDPAFLVTEFLTWLWWRTETGAQSFATDPDPAAPPTLAWVDGRVKLVGPLNKGGAVVTGDDAGTTAESRAALGAGKITEELGLGIRVTDQMEWTLRLRAPLADISGANFPPAGGEHAASAVWERLNLYEVLFDDVVRLLTLYAEARTGPGWDRTHSAIQGWIRAADPDAEGPAV